MSSVTILFMKKLSREFYLRDVNEVARDLLGKILVHNQTSGIIVEVEAYKGPEDKAAHTYNNKRTSRTEIQFREGGFVYVYMIYGMYYCFNVTANLPNMPEAVLVRALEPLGGIDLMKERRKTDVIKNLCNGPGKLCTALGIKKDDNGQDLCGEKIYILDGGINDIKIKTSPRINIDYAEEYKDFLWRYYIDGNEFVSKVKPKT